MASETWHQRFRRWRLDDLLATYSGLRLVPVADGPVRITGVLAFEASARNLETICDEYHVAIAIPDDFPRGLPTILETANRIPRSFHTNPDGTLCLGSPTRIKLLLSEGRPSLGRFVAKCVVPYLYGHSYFEKYKVMPFSELGHGEPGVIQDLASIFGASSDAAVRGFVRLAALTPRVANKAPCPCGSGRRLGTCHNRRVNSLRRQLGRAWFRIVLHEIDHPAT
jgi:hypothetical protein